MVNGAPDYTIGIGTRVINRMNGKWEISLSLSHFGIWNFNFWNSSMASYYNENTVLWLNGSLVKASEAKMDFYSQSLHYGYSVFEGIRSYKTVAGEARIFRAVEHFERLEQSALAINMPYKWTKEELIDATYQVLSANNFQDAYIRPVVYAPANMS